MIKLTCFSFDYKLNNSYIFSKLILKLLLNLKLIKLYQMNYLAHLFLAEDTPESILGNLLGDFAKGAAKEQYSTAIQHGIELHRKVDNYTDTHPIVREAKRSISSERKRYAGILIDVFYDHFLAKHWMKYSSIPLQYFTQKVYTLLLQQQNVLPDTLRQILPTMIQQDWLTSYQQISGVEAAIARIARRLKRGEPLVNGVEELKVHYQEFELGFEIFFPELISSVEQREFNQIN